jgi:hypothetical protein
LSKITVPVLRISSLKVSLGLIPSISRHHTLFAPIDGITPSEIWFGTLAVFAILLPYKYRKYYNIF